MRSLLYGILGIVIGAVFCITLISKAPQGTTRSLELTKQNQEQNEDFVAEENGHDIPEMEYKKILTYRVDNRHVEEYKANKVVTFGRINPMLYFTKKVEVPVEPVEEGEEILINSLGLLYNNIGGPENSITSMEDLDPNSIITEFMIESDTNVSEDALKFDWESYETSYVLPRGYLFGYNIKTKSLNIVDVSAIEDDVITNGKMPVDEEFYHIASTFGIRTNPITKEGEEFHKGLDISSEKIAGANVYAILDGEVVQATENGGYGNYVVLNHGQYSTVYAHFESIADGIKVGDKVKAGDILGYVGTTGRSTGPHLHLEFDFGGIKLTPRHFLNLIKAK